MIERRSIVEADVFFEREENRTLAQRNGTRFNSFTYWWVPQSNPYKTNEFGYCPSIAIVNYCDDGTQIFYLHNPNFTLKYIIIL